MQSQSVQSAKSYENHSSDNWPGATIPSNAASESWTEQTVTIPTGATTLQVGVNWNTVTAGEILYVNEVEITKLSTTAPEYQYHLKDHLGNVRTTFTTVVTTDQHTATLEAANLNTEQSQFLRIATAKRVSATIFDKTNGAATGYSERLNGSANEKYGVAKSISVMPGDVINAQVYGKYVDSNTSNWTGALTTLMSQIAANTAGVVVDGATYASSTSTFPFTGLLSTTGSTGGPKAYINWLIFDRNYTLLNGGYTRMSATPKEQGQDIAHELMTSPTINITQPGYVYIYLSNEETTPVEVYFDDFRVTHLKSPVVQTDDYYPFGLAYNSYSRENSVSNDWKFQGQEHVDDLGLNWDSFKWRNDQPEIGRFFNIDPLGENFYYNSPYAFAENRVINGVELEGLEWENFMSGFKKPKDLALKPVPSGEGVQHQSYNVVVANPRKALSDLRSTFKEKPQDVLSNSKAEFQPVDGDGNKLDNANLQEGSFLEIGILGFMNNSTVKVTGEESTENSFSYTFGTLEGHIEAGEISFSATQNKDGSISFGINSTSKVDSGYTSLLLEGKARKEQSASWQEVLTNVVKYLQGTEQSRTKSVEEDKNK